jgi:hypothetical protein
LAEQRHMLQSLLEERFQLKTHWETKEGDVYRLVVSKGGSKLGAAGSLPLSADERKGFGDRPVPALYQKNDGAGFDFLAHGCSMGQLVEVLAGQFGRPVSDETGLTGKYDFVLKYKGRWDQDRKPDDPDPTPPMDQVSYRWVERPPGKHQKCESVLFTLWQHSGGDIGMRGKQRNPRATLVTISMELSQRRNPGDAPCHSCNRNRERGTGLIETVWLRIRPTLNEHWDNGDMVNAHVFWSTYQATV